ncbi:MAG: hypothetical protein J6P61_04050, partial [Erysipelotrichaceae bacterium]|nr:hypothetical protein [Erysipelotrichaceae bacterium]
PCYVVDGERKIGLPFDCWEDYCDIHKERTYDDCAVNKPVERYARYLKSQGTELFVLSTAVNKNEILAKQVFIEERLPGLFTDVITVEEDDYKIDVIKQMADDYGVGLDECELIEDTFNTLLKANEIGIIPTHISQLTVDQNDWFKWTDG